MNLATILKQLRVERGLKQKELAAVLNLSTGTISNYENGIHFPDLMTLCAMADYFKVSTDYLLGRTDYKNSMKILDRNVDGSHTVKDWLNLVSCLPKMDRRIIYALIKSMKQLMDMKD